MTSAFVIRPAGPVPSTLARSTPLSAASFLATGVAFTSAEDSAEASVGVSAGVSAGAPPAGRAASVSIVPTMAPTSSSAPVSPVALSRPDAGLAISSVALSDSISRMISSFSTQSPLCFIQLPTVTSAIDSPGLGMVMSTLMEWRDPGEGWETDQVRPDRVQDLVEVLLPRGFDPFGFVDLLEPVSDFDARVLGTPSIAAVTISCSCSCMAADPPDGLGLETREMSSARPRGDPASCAHVEVGIWFAAPPGQ